MTSIPVTSVRRSAVFQYGCRYLLVLLLLFAIPSVQAASLTVLTQNLNRLFDDIDGMAAMIAALDLVVGVSIVTPYLAGAIGRTALVASLGRDWSLLGGCEEVGSVEGEP